MLAAALDAAARGWPVVPLAPDHKQPAFPDHTTDRCTGRDPRCRAAEHHVGWEPRTTTDPDRIRRAWSTRPYNVGIATGPAGLVVIDLDRPKPGEETPPQTWANDGVRDGGDVFAVLCDQAGQPWPGNTYTTRTGQGGTHLYYQHPPGCSCVTPSAAAATRWGG